MKKTVDRAAIAKSIAAHLIDSLLDEEPIGYIKLRQLAMDVAEARGIMDPLELSIMVGFAVYFVPDDPRIVVNKVESGNMQSWIYRKRMQQT